MSNVQPTSLKAYRWCVDNGITSKYQQRVIEALEMAGRPLTRKELSKRTGIDINCICAPVLNLLKLKVLVELMPRPCSVTGHDASPVWFAPRQPAQVELL